MLKSSLCDYSDAYILVCGTIIINREGGYRSISSKTSKRKKKGVTFKTCAPFRDCISKINNTDVDIEKNWML